MKVLQYNRLERLVGDKHWRIGPCYIADFPLANTVAHWAMLHCTGLPWTNTGVLGWVHFTLHLARKACQGQTLRCWAMLHFTRLERLATDKHCPFIRHKENEVK
jgi:hypothetical protein